MASSVVSDSTYFRFNIGEYVSIKCMKLPAMVAERYDCGGGIHMYKVVYWAEYRRNIESLYESELGEVLCQPK